MPQPLQKEKHFRKIFLPLILRRKNLPQLGGVMGRSLFLSEYFHSRDYCAHCNADLLNSFRIDSNAKRPSHERDAAPSGRFFQSIRNELKAQNYSPYGMLIKFSAIRRDQPLPYLSNTFSSVMNLSL